jgi:hypothetical protein
MTDSSGREDVGEGEVGSQVETSVGGYGGRGPLRRALG